LPGAALASGLEQSIFGDPPALFDNPTGTLTAVRALGFDTVQVTVHWDWLAPRHSSYQRPRHFKAADPGSYPAGSWVPYDAVVRQAASRGVRVELVLMGNAPLWATGPGAPNRKPHPSWEPNPREFQALVHAVGVRYSGGYTPPGAATAL